MKFKTLLIALLLMPFSFFGQPLSIDCSLDNGKINHVYKKVNNTVFHLNGSGSILEILLFDSEEEALLYMKKPNVLYQPNLEVDIDGVSVYLNSYSSASYYSPNEYNSGKVKQIGGTAFSYYSPNEYNSGLLKSIGGIAIKYYSPNEYNSGKVKKIGETNLNYYSPNEYNSERIKSVGEVRFNYYSPNEYNSGKIKSIGEMSFSYNSPHDYNPGKLKGIKGKDARFRLINLKLGLK